MPKMADEKSIVKNIAGMLPVGSANYRRLAALLRGKITAGVAADLKTVTIQPLSSVCR
jgi:hypothetical protein